MAFVKTFVVRTAGAYAREELTGYRHWHGESLEPHKHLIGERSEYVEWRWDVLVMQGDHYHRTVID